jgi:sulfur-oxidizing protein SoxB
MLTRRDFVQAAAAAGLMYGAAGSLGAAAATQQITQEKLLEFQALGQVTLLHFTDIHAQLVPLYFREPAINVGVGEDADAPPHLTGAHFLKYFKIQAQTPDAYALTMDDYLPLAREYGRLGGLDRMATLIKAIKAQRPGALLLDGGDSWQGSYTSLKERGADMVRAMNDLGVEAMTGHWEFTYGADRVNELIKQLKFPFLAGNIQDATWENWIFPNMQMFERNGVRIAVIGQAFPYTAIANPQWFVPNWSFGIHEKRVQAEVNDARAKKADLVVLLSHNGFDVDKKLASRVQGIDVILGGHTHDAVPLPTKVGKTLIIASGSHGKFLSRLDIDVKDGGIADYRYRLIPIFSDAIAPDAEIAATIAAIRKPYAADLARVLGRTDTLLYRRGNFNGTFDDLICDALLKVRDVQIAMSPGFRWGATLLPEQAITLEDLYNQTAITYPAAYKTTMTGANLKSVFEDVADNIFNLDPYYQQGGDMVRVGGLSYTIDVSKKIGSRISDMRLLSTGELLDPNKSYTVAGWASVRQGTEGPPIWDVVQQYLASENVVKIPERQNVRIAGANSAGIS